MSAEKLQVQTHIRNLMRLFIQSIRSYEHESGHSVYDDDREDLEFVDIFIDSEDAFDMEYIYKVIQTKTERERKLFEAINKRISHIETLGKGYGINQRRIGELKWVLKTLEECKPTIEKE